MATPPPGLSMMEEMKWKQAQKSKGASGASETTSTTTTKPPLPAGSKPPPPPGPPPGAKKDASPSSSPSGSGGGGTNATAAAAAVKPPPGLSLIEEMKWKQNVKNGVPNTPPPPPPSSKGDDKPKGDDKAKAMPSGGLAAKQKMLEGMFASQGKGPAPAEKKSDKPPAKKWGTVDTEGGGSGSSDMAEAANALAAKLGAPAAKKGGDDVCPDLSKYEKMAKMLPQGAVENAMNRDGVDPGWMFGADCVTCKSDKRPPAKGAAGPASNPSPLQQQQQIPQFSPPNMTMQQHQPQFPTSNQQPRPQQFPAGLAQQQVYGSMRTMNPGLVQHQAYGSMARMTNQPPPMHAPPGQWTQVWSAEYNQVYYTNLATGESTWNQPPGFVPPPPMANTRPIVTMMYNFQGTGANPGELSVMANDQIEVYEVGMDGWTTGRCIRTGQVGLLPSNYAR